MEILKKIVSILLDIIIVIISILVILTLIYMFQTKIQHKKSANLLGFTAFKVATGSMADTINIGDLVIVKITDKVNLNDIIVYQDNNYFVTHRLIKIEKDRYITKGDANNSQDTPIVPSQVLGKVILVISPSKMKIESIKEKK